MYVHSVLPLCSCVCFKHNFINYWLKILILILYESKFSVYLKLVVGSVPAFISRNLIMLCVHILIIIKHYYLASTTMCFEIKFSSRFSLLIKQLWKTGKFSADYLSILYYLLILYHRICISSIHIFWYINMPDVTASYETFFDFTAFFGYFHILLTNIPVWNIFQTFTDCVSYWCTHIGMSTCQIYCSLWKVLWFNYVFGKKQRV